MGRPNEESIYNKPWFKLFIPLYMIFSTFLHLIPDADRVISVVSWMIGTWFIFFIIAILYQIHICVKLDTKYRLVHYLYIFAVVLLTIFINYISLMVIKYMSINKWWIKSLIEAPSLIASFFIRYISKNVRNKSRKLLYKKDEEINKCKTQNIRIVKANIKYKHKVAELKLKLKEKDNNKE